MTKKHCPTCHQPVPDALPLATRIRAALAAAAPQPLPPKRIRQLCDSNEAVTYQTLRRMRDRGEIRKSITAFGEGWILVPEEGDIPQVEDAQTHAISNLETYVESAGGVSIKSAVGFLKNLGIEDEMAEVIVESAIKAGKFSESEGRIYA